MTAQQLETFDDWLKYQQIDSQALPEDKAVILRSEYERARAAAMATKVYAMGHRPRRPGEYRYAIAIEDGEKLWLTLWIKRSPSGDCFILYPRGQGNWNPHASYHRDGRYHHKSYDQKSMVQMRQPLDQFTGAEHLGSFAGHGPCRAICDPAGFTSVLRVPRGILESRHGYVLVDLVEPGQAPAAHHREVPGLRIVKEETYRDCSPWVVVAIAEQTGLNY